MIPYISPLEDPLSQKAPPTATPSEESSLSDEAPPSLASDEVSSSRETPSLSSSVLNVILDGRVVGVVKSSDAVELVKVLRYLKVTGKHEVLQMCINVYVHALSQIDFSFLKSTDNNNCTCIIRSHQHWRLLVFQ